MVMCFRENFASLRTLEADVVSSWDVGDYSSRKVIRDFFFFFEEPERRELQ